MLSVWVQVRPVVTLVPRVSRTDPSAPPLTAPEPSYAATPLWQVGMHSYLTSLLSLKTHIFPDKCS